MMNDDFGLLTSKQAISASQEDLPHLSATTERVAALVEKAQRLIREAHALLERIERIGT